VARQIGRAEAVRECNRDFAPLDLIGNSSHDQKRVSPIHHIEL